MNVENISDGLDEPSENIEEHEGISRSARTFTMSQLLRSFYLRRIERGSDRPQSRAGFSSLIPPHRQQES
jgi:hypothetical protein